MENNPNSNEKLELKKDSIIKLIIHFFNDKKQFLASRLRNIIIKSHNIGIIKAEQKNYDTQYFGY